MTYDVIVVGGGLVGSSFVCALSKLPLKIALVEAKDFQSSESDTRSLVLSEASVNIFSALGFWQEIAKFAHPIHEIQVSHQGHFGQVRFKAAEHNVAAFGYLIAAKKLLTALRKSASTANVDVISPAKTVSFDEKKSIITVQTHDGLKTLQAKLIVAADGTHSTLRQLSHIAIESCDYGEDFQSSSFS